ncbi:hypothetical protein F6X39_07470 [Paraburkholderia sp. UCT2]|nr:hypothetical protein [Paraburkholderia sp. UCT2]
MTNIVRTLLAIFSLLFFWCSTSSAAEEESYRIPFLGGQVNIEFRPEKTPDGDGIGAYITGVREKGPIRVDYYEPEGGVTPDVKSVFVAGRKPKKLFVIVAWSADSSALGTGGSIYRVFAYDERIENNGRSLQLHPDTELTNRFGVGFDGTREGHLVTYKYKNALAVRRQILEWGYK